MAFYLWMFYGLFLIYCAVHGSMRRGDFQRAPLPIRLVSMTYVVPAYVIDVFFNLFPLFGPMLFWESPLAHVEWTWSGVTFTHRCRWHKTNGAGWRRWLGRFICDSGLDPFDVGHC